MESKKPYNIEDFKNKYLPISNCLLVLSSSLKYFFISLMAILSFFVSYYFVFTTVNLSPLRLYFNIMLFLLIPVWIFDILSNIFNLKVKNVIEKLETRENLKQEIKKELENDRKRK